MVKEILQKNGDKPLFLPEGSVRSIITLLLVGAYIGAAYLAMFKGLDAPVGLKEAMVLVLGFYFLKRAQATVKE